VNSPVARNFLRISIGTRGENVRTVQALAKAVGAEIPAIPI
jgi:hypothetical protein